MRRRPAVARLLAPALLLALGACVEVRPGVLSTPANEVAVEREGRFVGLIGPRVQHSDPYFGVRDTNFYCLRSWLDRNSGEVTHQLYLTESYSGAKRNWNAASDNRGSPLRFVPIRSDEISCDRNCSYAEEFAAALPENLLRGNPQGFSVSFTSASGARLTIPVADKLITKQLAAVDAARRVLARSAER